MERATKVIEKGTYYVILTDYCLNLFFFEKAKAHSNDPELRWTEYCMISKFDGRRHEKPCGKWMINANNEPKAAGLKTLFRRLISHCRKHPNLKLVHLAIKGNPYVLLESKKRI